MNYLMRRFGALALDYTLVLPYLLVLSSVGLALRESGVLPTAGTVNPLFAQVVGFLILTLPVVLFLAYLDSDRSHGTFGKRRFGLRVLGSDQRSIPLSQSIGRTLIKVALPWELAHAALWQIANGGSDVLIALLYVACYAVAIAQVVLAVIRSRRTLHDRVASTTVVLARHH